MFRLLLIIPLLCFALSYADDSVEDTTILKVVGGTRTDIKNYPHQVSLEVKGIHNCGGSIYNPNVIITAAHCVNGVDSKRMIVRAGTSRIEQGGILDSVKSYRIHPNFNSKTFHYDIALLFLEKPLPYGSTIKPIALPADGAKLPIKQVASLSGWGLTSENGIRSKDLQHLDVPIWDSNSCSSSYPGQITSSMLCAGYFSGGKSACKGDSGGPLTWKNELYGVVSWGVGCARPRRPGVYVNVIAVKSWIKQTAAAYAS